MNSNYALEVTGGSRGPRVFLRVYEEQDDAGAHAEADLLAHLAARGVHTPAPIPARDGARIATVAGKPAALFPWAPGHMRCQKSVTPEDAAKVGAEVACAWRNR